jgi:Tn7-like transposition protein D/TniQ
MIGCFPDPFRDELLYSACARFSVRVQYPNKKSILRELFGTKNCTATIELPSHLTKLVSALPPGHLYTADQVIDDHTLLPLYSPFLPRGRVTQLRNGMAGLGGHVLHGRAGLMASRISTPKWFRFCPACVTSDGKDFGETYWHRLHQLPGILTCPRHNVFLEDSRTRRDSARDALRFVPAEDAVRTVTARHLDISDSTHQLLLKLARDGDWLLSQKNLGEDLNNVYSRYLNLLIGRGLATYTGSIHVKELLGEFTTYYSPALLKLLYCELKGGDVEKTNWLLRLARPNTHAQHPLYHLLLMEFFGHTIEEFFRFPTKLNLFGEGPWLCLNPAAEHFREPVLSRNTRSLLG